jgi:hypothetical protein
MYWIYGSGSPSGHLLAGHSICELAFSAGLPFHLIPLKVPAMANEKNCTPYQHPWWSHAPPGNTDINDPLYQFRKGSCPQNLCGSFFTVSIITYKDFYSKHLFYAL